MITEPLFAAGRTVQILDTRSIGHCRTPRYTQGAFGTIESYIGSFRNPEELAYGGSGLPPSPLYWVRIRLCELFEGYQGVTTDTLLVEVYEHWLAPTESQEPIDEQ